MTDVQFNFLSTRVISVIGPFDLLIGGGFKLIGT